MPIKDRIHATTGWLRGTPDAGGPHRLVIEISNACNLRCAMCLRNTMVRKIEFMQPDVFEPLIRNNRRILEFVGLNGYGEPLLHPHLARYLDYCRRQGVKTGISTNCTLLDDEHAEKLLASPPDQLILAIDGVSADCYEKVRVGAKFDLVVHNVKRFLERCLTARQKPLISLQCIHMTETHEAVSKFKHFFKGLPYDAIRIRQLTYRGRDCDDDSYVNDQGSCYWLWHEPMVLASGDLVPCCQDANGDLVLGNVAEKPLRELWSQGRILALRTAHGKGKRETIPICKACNMYQPGSLLSIGATALDTEFLNRLLPGVETILSKIRYRKG